MGGLRVVVSGATGRLGSAITAGVESADDLELVGRVAPSLGVDLASRVAGGREAVDVVVEVSTSATVAENALTAVRAGVDLVIGATGLGADAAAAIDAAAREQGVRAIDCPNFSLGAVLMMRFAAQALELMGEEGARAEIVELHHERKVDAPSGTAKLTAERMGGDVPIHSVRLPGLVAHQEVLIGGPGQLLTIRHDAMDRSCFVPGALRAIRRVRDLAPGLTVGLEHVL